jgi:hypothetical protein
MKKGYVVKPRLRMSVVMRREGFMCNGCKMEELYSRRATYVSFVRRAADGNDDIDGGSDVADAPV